MEELHDKHLVAEYRELPRIFGLAKAAFERGEKPGENAPGRYTLGKGHVRFFYDKLQWLFNRQVFLVKEMIRRGFNPIHRNPLTLVNSTMGRMSPDWFKNWEPDEEAMTLNRQRINERLEAMNGNTPRL